MQRKQPLLVPFIHNHYRSMNTKLLILTLSSLLVLPALSEERDGGKKRGRDADLPARAGENAGRRAGKKCWKAST